jgi:glycerate-2-kinase
LSLVKGGRLAAACQARLLVTLAISDVAGDPPQVIGSGPTVPVNSQPGAALEILERRGLLEKLPPAVIRTLQSATEKPAEPITVPMAWQVVASNSASLQAAAGQAEELGYRVAQVLRDVQGDAATAGADFQRRLQALKQQSRGQRLCLLAGGETTVNLASAGENPGRGGRNQEFVLSAAQVAADSDAQHSTEGSADWALLSGGTDGEDGPTDAAGGILDKQILKAILAGGYEIQDCLTRHDSWTLLDSVGALIRTGATHTNVMDIAVGLTAT